MDNEHDIDRLRRRNGDLEMTIRTLIAHGNSLALNHSPRNETDWDDAVDAARRILTGEVEE